MTVSHADVGKLALALPEVEEGTSYGTAAWRVAGNLFARAHKDGESLVVRCNMDLRELLMEGAPDIYFITDHYLNHDWVQIRLAAAEPAQVKEALMEAWQMRAPKRLKTDAS